MCGIVEPTGSDLKRIIKPSDIEMTEEEAKNPDTMKVFVLRRYIEEGDSDWLKGLDVVVAHTLQEAIDLAEATHPGSKKFGEYKSYKVVDVSYPHFAYGRAFDLQVVHW